MTEGENHPYQYVGRKQYCKYCSAPEYAGHTSSCPWVLGDVATPVADTRDPFGNCDCESCNKLRKEIDVIKEERKVGKGLQPYMTALTKQVLPVDSQARKDTPVYSGCLNYFPNAIAAVARLSKLGNDKHNPGEPLHWSKEKSNDHEDCIARHLLDADKIDPETGMPHAVQVAWRALALAETILTGYERKK